MPTRALDRLVRPLLLSAVLLHMGACVRALPEAGGPDAQLYQTKCGVCHQAFQPALLTSAMWEAQLDMMTANEMRRAGIALSKDQRQRILDYLGRHAAGRQEEGP